MSEVSEEIGNHLILGMTEGSWGEKGILSLNRVHKYDSGFSIIGGLPYRKGIFLAGSENIIKA